MSLSVHASSDISVIAEHGNSDDDRNKNMGRSYITNAYIHLPIFSVIFLNNFIDL
jgi:hypothetical protein